MEKLEKIYKKINITEDEDEKNLLVNYFMKKYKSFLTDTEKSTDRMFSEHTLNLEKYYKNLEKFYQPNIDPIIDIIKKEKYFKLKEILERTRVDWRKYNKKMITPLHLAIENGDKKMVILLLENNYPFWLQNGNNYTPLELACFNEDGTMIKLLLDYEIDVKKILYYRDLNKKVFFNNLNFDFIILSKKLLIEGGYSPNFRNQKRDNIRYIGMSEYTWEDFHCALGIYLKEKHNKLLKWYLEIFKNDETKYEEREWINFWFLFNFDFKITWDKIFFEEFDYCYNLVKKSDKKDKMLLFEEKILYDYHFYSKKFRKLLIHLWRKNNNL